MQIAYSSGEEITHCDNIVDGCSSPPHFPSSVLFILQSLESWEKKKQKPHLPDSIATRFWMWFGFSYLYVFAGNSTASLLLLLMITVTEVLVGGVQSFEVQVPCSVGADGGQAGLLPGWRQSPDHRDFPIVVFLSCGYGDVTVSQWLFDHRGSSNHTLSSWAAIRFNLDSVSLIFPTVWQVIYYPEMSSCSSYSLFLQLSFDSYRNKSN